MGTIVRFVSVHGPEFREMELIEYLSYELANRGDHARYAGQQGREIRLLAVLVEKRMIDAEELCNIIYGPNAMSAVKMAILRDDDPAQSEIILTVGQVAKLCGVAAKTVQTWCDREMLECYRIGRGGDRRIRKRVLDNFVAKHGMPPVDMSLLKPKKRR